MKKFPHYLFLMSILLFGLSGCGFHLRGHAPMPPQLSVLYLQSDQPYSALTKELRQVLRSAKITLTQNAASAPITLQIVSDRFTQQVTSLGASGQTSTYQLNYVVSYQLLTRQGQVILGPDTVTSSHSYSITTNQVLSGINYQSNLQAQMQREVIFQIMERLRSARTMRALRNINID